MACSACQRRRERMIAERQRRKDQGQKLVPGVIDATLAVFDMLPGAKPAKERKGGDQK